MRRMLAVMERDLRRMMRNPLTLLSVVVLPLVYLVVLGNSLQGPLHGLRLGVVVQDDGAESRALVGALQAVAHGPRTVKLVAVGDPAAGKRLLHDGRIAGLLVIPPRFSEAVGRGENAAIGLFVDNVDAVAAQAITAAVQGALASIGQPLARFELHLGPAETRVQEVYPRVDYDASLVPGVVVMAIFMGSLISGGFNLVLDRFLGVHESYLSTPLRRWEIAFGILASGVVVTLISSGIVLVAGLLVTGARIHGGWLGGLAVMAIVLLTSIGLLGMMMVVVGRAAHPRIVGAISGFLNVILFFPSGALYPVASFPGWLRAFARLNPETYAIDALKTLFFRGGHLAVVGRDAVFLAGFAVVMLITAALTLKRTL